jgi:hypothetical protein
MIMTTRDNLSIFVEGHTDHLRATREAILDLFFSCSVLWNQHGNDGPEGMAHAKSAWEEARKAFANANEYLALAEFDLGEPGLSEQLFGESEDTAPAAAEE